MGKFYKPDEEGFITDTLSLRDIDEDNWFICNYFTKEAVSFYGENLHSVYVTGTVSKDSYDKDFVIVISDYSFINTPNTTSFISTLNPTIPFDIEFFTPQNFSIDRKFESVCLYGDDLTEKKVVFKEYIKTHPFAQDIHGLPKIYYKLLIKEIEKSTRLSPSWCKVILRKSVFLVALKVNKYSRDLYYCCKFYEEYYPHRGQYMWDVLDLYLNPEEHYDDYKLILYKSIQCLLEEE